MQPVNPSADPTFTSQEQDVISGLGSYAGKLGYAYLVTGIGLLLVGAFQMIGLLGSTGGSLLALAIAVLVLVILAALGGALVSGGRALTQAGRAFEGLRHSDWSDRDNFTMATESLKRAASLQVVFAVLALLNASLGLVRLALH